MPTQIFHDDGTSEILVSESTLERVWFSDQWDVRIERTELGEKWHALRTAPEPVSHPHKKWVWAAAGAGVAISAAAVERLLF